jgi:hypothetical protein
MTGWVWVLVAIFVPNALGFIAYFLLRKPLAARCPYCGAIVASEYVHCPSCGHKLAPNCPSCGRAVHVGDVYCPYCGHALQPTASTPVNSRP